MNQLRQLMLEELQRRNFAATTIRTYLHGVEHFSRYFRRPPDQLGPEDIRKYQAMLFTKLKFSPNIQLHRGPVEGGARYQPEERFRQLRFPAAALQLGGTGAV